jgi:hypothetical protein
VSQTIKLLLLSFAQPEHYFLFAEKTAENEEADMRRQFAFTLCYLIIILSAWAGSFEATQPSGNRNKAQSLPQGAG